VQISEARSYPDPPAHPSIESIIEYVSGTLDPEAADSVQEHLAQCRSCATLLLDLERFSEAEKAAVEESVEGHLLYREVRQRVRADRWRAGAALAAALLVAVLVPLIVFVGKDRRSATAAKTLPEANLRIASLLPRSMLRSGSDTNRLAVAPADRLVGFVLAAGDVPAARDYELTLLDATGRRALVLRGLRPTANGTFSVGLPAALLVPGRFQLRLNATYDGTSPAIETYDLEVARATAPDASQPQAR
jgi:anti-sigma factor RsiW